MSETQTFPIALNSNAAKVHLYTEGAVLTKKGTPVLGGAHPIDCPHVCLLCQSQVLLQLVVGLAHAEAARALMPVSVAHALPDARGSVPRDVLLMGFIPQSRLSLPSR